MVHKDGELPELRPEIGGDGWFDEGGGIRVDVESQTAIWLCPICVEHIQGILLERIFAKTVKEWGQDRLTSYWDELIDDLEKTNEAYRAAIQRAATQLKDVEE